MEYLNSTKVSNYMENNEMTNEELEFLKTIGVEQVDDTLTLKGIENYKTYNNLTPEQFETMKEKMKKKIEASIKYYEDNSSNLLTCDKKEGQWNEMSEEDIADFASQFLVYENDALDLSKFDYEIYGEDYYREKFPNFPNSWYPIMAEASRDKVSDKRTPTFSKINNPTTLSFS